jgi:DNA-binding NarL/FixJ family response regulator
MNIIIIDDDKLVCSALQTILESDPDLHVPATGHAGEDAIPLYERYGPDLLLMDIRMSGITGVDAGEALLKKHPKAKILFLTTFTDNEYIVKALKIGAKGYLLKQNFESIVPSIKAVVSGQSVFGDEIVSKLPNITWSPSSFQKLGLTEREIDIMTQVADGLSNKEIAATLFLSEGTVRNYISTVLEKLNLRDRTQLAVFYYKHLG